MNLRDAVEALAMYEQQQKARSPAARSRQAVMRDRIAIALKFSDAEIDRLIEGLSTSARSRLVGRDHPDHPRERDAESAAWADYYVARLDFALDLRAAVRLRYADAMMGIGR